MLRIYQDALDVAAQFGMDSPAFPFTVFTDGRGEVVFYNLGKFSQAISDFESIHFHSSPVEKYKSFAGFLRHHAEHVRVVRAQPGPAGREGPGKQRLGLGGVA